MGKTYEYYGRTVDDALDIALKDLHTEIDKIEYSIIDIGSSGFFSKRPACIEVILLNDNQVNIRDEKFDLYKQFTYDEIKAIEFASEDINFIKAMSDLKKSDPIEFQLKMSQFKASKTQIDQIKEQERSQIKCPRCGSTQITTGARGANYTTGFIGASKTVNRCAKCGHTWSPR